MNQICSRCIMDDSDPGIIFDAEGICDYCNNFDENILPDWSRGLVEGQEVKGLIDKIKSDCSHLEYDCIIGLSGGLDSSYLAYVTKELFGLRPLLFHVDAGWNTDQAVSNIEKLVNGLGLDLYTEVINWNEMRDLQIAFLKSQIADQDMPQDIAFFSALYKFAKKNQIKYVFTGSNYSTECCREPEAWGAYPGIDKILINDIHKRFGSGALTSFPIVDIFMYKIYYQKILGMSVVKPLNMIPYVKKQAEDKLEELFGWQRFQHKHHESRFTRFYEDYWLPRKFGYHKRRAHFSSLILTSQMTRDEALSRIANSEMSESFLIKEFEYIAHKLGLSVDELSLIFSGQNKSFSDYRNKRWAIGLGSNVLRLFGAERRLFR